MKTVGLRLVPEYFVSFAVVGFVSLCLLPSVALGQSSISGVVRDASGAVVANASVEAASDVLIERSRTVTTNAEGRYSIVDLRPGTYVVTMSAPGFATMKQTIVVPANVTVPVDADLGIEFDRMVRDHGPFESMRSRDFLPVNVDRMAGRLGANSDDRAVARQIQHDGKLRIVEDPDQNSARDEEGAEQG